MKKLFLAAAILFAFSAQSQVVDTVKSSIQIQPIVTNQLTHDTAYQLTWLCLGLTRDTSQSATFYIALYDRKQKKCIDMNTSIPPAILNQWGTSDTIIDDYVLAQYGLLKRN